MAHKIKMSEKSLDRGARITGKHPVLAAIVCLAGAAALFFIPQKLNEYMLPEREPSENPPIRITPIKEHYSPPGEEIPLESEEKIIRDYQENRDFYS